MHWRGGEFFGDDGEKSVDRRVGGGDDTVESVDRDEDEDLPQRKKFFFSGVAAWVLDGKKKTFPVVAPTVPHHAWTLHTSSHSH